MSVVREGELQGIMEKFLKEHHYVVTTGWWDNELLKDEHGNQAFILKAEREGVRLTVNHQNALDVTIRKEKWATRRRFVQRSGVAPRWEERVGDYDLLKEQTFNLYDPRIMEEFMAMVEQDV